MKNNITNFQPIFLVVAPKSHKLASLNQYFKYIIHTKVTWKRHVNKKQIIHCHRCQAWEHTTSNCRIGPRSLKCGDKHLTPDCKKPADTSAKCATCSDNHPANSVECSADKRTQIYSKICGCSTAECERVA